MAKREITDEMRAKWRAAALKNRPWMKSSGPKTAEGKAQSALNGKARQKGEFSYRELLGIAQTVRAELRASIAFRKEAAKQLRDQRRAAKMQH
jgi:hypothetical protein